MTDFQPGDEIDVTYRGVVRRPGGTAGETFGTNVVLDLIPNGYINLSLSAASTINVVTKRSPQVGDTLLGLELSNSALLPGSVARYSGLTSNQKPWVRTTTRWRSTDDAGPVFDLAATFTILYLGA